jgi:hypothetical protein
VGEEIGGYAEMSVSSIISGGVRLIRTQPQVIAIWVVLYFIGLTLFTLAFRPFMGSILEAQRQAAANAAMGIKTPPMLPAVALRNLFVLELILLVLVVIAFAAVVRAVARPTRDRFAYLRIGMDELRLIGLGLLLTILFFLAEIIGILVVVLLAALSAFIIGKIGSIVIGVILGFALFLAFIYAQVRLSLTGAFTVIQGRIVIRDAWRATKGHFWTLFGAYLLMGLVFLIVGIAMIAVTSPHLLAAYASFNLQAMQAAAQEQYMAQSAGITFGYIIQMTLGAVIGIPLYVALFGSVATAAVEMGGVRSTIAAEFE